MLTPVQRELAVWRLEQEAGAGEAHEETSSVKAYASALVDPKVSTLPRGPVRSEPDYLSSTS